MSSIIKTISCNDLSVTSLSWTDIGLSIGCIDGTIFFCGTSTTRGTLVRIKDPISYKEHKFAISSLCSLGNVVISISLDESIGFYNSVDLSFHSKNIVPRPFCLCSCPNFNCFFVGSIDGSIFIIKNENVEKSLKISSDPISSLAYVPQTHSSLILSKNKLFQLDLGKMQVIKELTLLTKQCNCISVSFDGFTTVITANDGTIRIVDIISFREIGCQLIHECELNDIVTNQDGTMFVTTDMKGYVGRFSVESMSLHPAMNISKYFLKAIACHPTEFLIAVGGQEPGVSVLKF